MLALTSVSAMLVNIQDVEGQILLSNWLTLQTVGSVIGCRYYSINSMAQWHVSSLCLYVKIYTSR